jgi:AraC-like DNA-binding protein
MEWTIILQLLSVIRKSLGSDFYPTEVGFQVPFTLCQDASNMMPNARILFGRPKTSLAMSDEVLSWSVRGAGQHRRSDDALHGTAKPSAPPVIDFPGSLRLAMRSYLSDGHPSINIAAGIIGVSARTLQRRLAEDGQTYSAMIQQARFEVASELLEQPELKIIDVAYAAGYEDPSHFSRAFRRIAGVSPREYRQHIHALA